MITKEENESSATNDHPLVINKASDKVINDAKVPPSLAIYPSFYPPFPEPGSLLGGRYFVLERLGQGTFCSIHKCIDLSYIPNFTPERLCFVAAKVELSSFTNSGVLEGEAMVLRHLHQAKPDGSFPIFCEYLRNVPTLINPTALSGEQTQQPQQQQQLVASSSSEPSTTVSISAIIMEYLPGEDMARLRDRYLSNLRRFNYSIKLNSAENTSVKSYSVGPENMMIKASMKNLQLQQQKTPPIKNEDVPIRSVSVGESDEQPNRLLAEVVPSSALPSSTQQYYCSRRINVNDAIYLCADVLLPLIQTMHDTGVIHRDVKPSNCVRKSTSSENKEFVLVDFGLSKSFVVPEDSSFADPSRPWAKPWSGVSVNASSSSGTSSSQQKAAVLRKERVTADFRGTSMYASLRVHQQKDYCRRDDLWSLWYVFCDFVSGGLPWMISAKQREREACQRLKEEIHKNDNERAGELLFGPTYHARITATSGKGGDSLTTEEIESLKLLLPNHKCKVKHLRTAFQHLCSLDFADEPDYALMERCLRGFSDMGGEDGGFEDVPTFEWDMPEQKVKRTPKNFFEENISGLSLVEYCQSQSNWMDCSSELLRDLKMAKADYNSRNCSYYKQLTSYDVRPHLLADWVSASSDLLNFPWDVTKLERWGANRSTEDDYRRENYVQAIERCLAFAESFGNFRHHSYFNASDTVDPKTENGNLNEHRRPRKRSRLLKVSIMNLLQDLAYAKDQEMEKAFAPPPKISFSASFSGD